MSYSDNRKKHLCSYASNSNVLKDVMGGTHKGNQKEYGHIIKINKTKDKNDQYRKVVQYNLLEGVKPDMLKIGKLHSMAHYLTSSQILCYNFFRPLLDDSGHPTDRFISLLKSKNIAITNNAVGEFEYNPNEYGKDRRHEHTEFDFHIVDDTTGTEVFFEIKYTENGFGHWNKRYATKDNFNNFYKDMFTNCLALNQQNPDFDDFCRNFQLYRNVLRVQRENQFSIFVFPEQNNKVKKEFKEFEDKIKTKSNVFSWSWDELTKGVEETEFYKKYFSK